MKDTGWSCHGQPLPVVVKGCDRKGFLACSGNGNGSSWNNRALYGNYWSRSLNSQANGRHLYFNNGDVNPQDYNNRYYGFVVRAVQHSILGILFFTDNLRDEA